MHCVSECSPDVKVKKITIKTDSRGYRLVVTIDVPFGTQLTGKVHKLQQYIIDKIETFTGILIEEVSIVIDKITKVDAPAVQQELQAQPELEQVQRVGHQWVQQVELERQEQKPREVERQGTLNKEVAYQFHYQDSLGKLGSTFYSRFHY